MSLDIQKASMLKRISAGILDLILLVVLTVGFVCLVAVICDFDSHYDSLTGYFEKYEKDFGVDFEFVDSVEFKELPEEDQQAYVAKCEEAYKAFNEDAGAVKEYSLVMSLTLVMVTFGILLAYLVLEFILPLVFKNGQTIGKKVFGIAVMHTNRVRVSAMSMFIRTFLGKYVVETMVPVLMIIMFLFGTLGITGIIVAAAVYVLDIIVLIATKTRSLIHDVFAKTVCVDLASQMIYATQEEMLEATRIAQYESEHPEYVPGTFSFDKTTDGEKIVRDDTNVSVGEVRADIVIVDDDQPIETPQNVDGEQ